MLMQVTQQTGHTCHLAAQHDVFELLVADLRRWIHGCLFKRTDCCTTRIFCARQQRNGLETPAGYAAQRREGAAEWKMRDGHTRATVTQEAAAGCMTFRLGDCDDLLHP